MSVYQVFLIKLILNIRKYSKNNNYLSNYPKPIN